VNPEWKKSFGAARRLLLLRNDHCGLLLWTSPRYNDRTPQTGQSPVTRLPLALYFMIPQSIYTSWNVSPTNHKILHCKSMSWHCNTTRDAYHTIPPASLPHFLINLKEGHLVAYPPVSLPDSAIHYDM
jgi:hypothetical protein